MIIITGGEACLASDFGLTVAVIGLFGFRPSRADEQRPSTVPMSFLLALNTQAGFTRGPRSSTTARLHAYPLLAFVLLSILFSSRSGVGRP